VTAPEVAGDDPRAPADHSGCGELGQLVVSVEAEPREAGRPGGAGT
jgi:hypothetical protein